LVIRQGTRGNVRGDGDEDPTTGCRGGRGNGKTFKRIGHTALTKKNVKRCHGAAAEKKKR